MTKFHQRIVHDLNGKFCKKKKQYRLTRNNHLKNTSACISQVHINSEMKLNAILYIE